MTSMAILLLLLVLRKTASDSQVDELKRKLNDRMDRIGDAVGRAEASADKAAFNARQAAEMANEAAKSMRPETLDAICRGVSENTYSVLKSLIAAVEENDVNRLSDVVRAAKHMCGRFELAAKARP